MASSRGLDRLLAFSDATVAIAITLLILPLVEIAQEVQDRPVGDFLGDHAFALFSFGLSFLVISVFWRVHHTMYEDVERAGPALVRANLVWLASIVFLPFPTELLDADRDPRLTHGIYVGTLVVASAAQAVQKSLILRDGGTPSPVRGDLVSLALMTIAFVLVVAVPATGLWGLLVLLLSTPVEKVMGARAAA